MRIVLNSVDIVFSLCYTINKFVYRGLKYD